MTLCRISLLTGDLYSGPIIADALQDAGCDDEEMLSTLRAPEYDFRQVFFCQLILVEGEKVHSLQSRINEAPASVSSLKESPSE